MSTRPPAGITEGQTLTHDVHWRTDVCVVGSGAGGAVTAALLAAAGQRVVVLEEGGYFTSLRFRMLEGEAYRDLYQEAMSRSNHDGTIAILQGRAVGGTTVVNWTTSLRTPDDVLALWRRHGAEPWTPDLLAPHFTAVEARLGIHKVPLAEANANNRLLYEGCRALGYAVDTIPRNVRGCIQSGYCGLGCPVDAKQSMLLTYLVDAVAAGAAVVSRARVERLVRRGDRIVAVEGRFLDATGVAPTGQGFRVEADRFVLAAGAIGSPALLLRSEIVDPAGLTGKRTFLHPVVASIAEFAEPVAAYYGAPQSVASDHFRVREGAVGFLLEAAPAQPVLAAAAMPGFGRAHLARIGRLPHLAVHIALTADGQLPTVPGGEVELREDGSPVLRYRVAEPTWAAFRVAQRVLAEVQLAAGARRVWTLHDPPVELRSRADLAAIERAPWRPGSVAIFSAHVMGGCGASEDPRRGVVRARDLRHHAVANLYVADGSVFPTAPGVNPQETIYTLVHATVTGWLRG